MYYLSPYKQQVDDRLRDLESKLEELLTVLTDDQLIQLRDKLPCFYGTQNRNSAIQELDRRAKKVKGGK